MKSNSLSMLKENHTMFRTLAVAVCASAAIALSSQAGHAQSATKDIVDTAAGAGTFNTLAKALQSADLVDTLRGAGPFTVFAPTDEAFAKLPQSTLTDLLRPENQAKLQRILKYHVVPGKVSSSQVVAMRSAKTVSGDAITIKSTGGSVMVDNARVVKADIGASNGVIHVVDTVILPAGAR
jgi:uncharacterized surface protein with fasciclin (FAS1) repeats